MTTCVSYEVEPVNCVVPNALQPRNHEDGSTLTRFACMDLNTDLNPEFWCQSLFVILRLSECDRVHPPVGYAGVVTKRKNGRKKNETIVAHPSDSSSIVVVSHLEVASAFAVIVLV